MPRKRHWKENADIQGNEKVLQCLVDNYKKEGIKSLALHELGCDFGNLSWKDVGPLICKYLTGIDINVRVYLPAEKKVPEEYLSKEFLLSKKS